MVKFPSRLFVSRRLCLAARECLSGGWTDVIGDKGARTQAQQIPTPKIAPLSRLMDRDLGVITCNNISNGVYYIRSV